MGDFDEDNRDGGIGRNWQEWLEWKEPAPDGLAL